MNCRHCQDQWNAYLEGLLEPSALQRIESHLEECPDCRAELDIARELANRLTCMRQVSADASLDIPVMDRILQEQAVELRRLRMKRRIRWMQAGGAMTAAVVLIIFVGLWSAHPNRAMKAAEFRLCAAEVMAKGAEAASGVSTIHIRAKMRTHPAGNFDSVGTQFDMVPVEVWKQFGRESGDERWRIEKPGLVIVMDGESTVLFSKEQNRFRRIPEAFKDPFDTTWFHHIADVDSSINNELRSALAKGWDLKVIHSADDPETGTTTVVVDVRSEPEEFEYLRNRSLLNMDSVRTYHFDRVSGRLEGLEVHYRDALMFETTEIEYDQPIGPDVFALKLPEDAVPFEIKEPKELPDNEKYARMTANEAARAFLESLAREDWDECEKFCLEPPSDEFKKRYGGLEILQIGEAYIPDEYAGWYVPYDIRLKSGKVKKWNLALRNNNRAKRFLFDGGL